MKKALMVLLIVGLLASCQYRPQYQPWNPAMRPIVYEVPPISKQGAVTFKKAPQSVRAKQTVRRKLKPQSTFMDPPVPPYGYHARLDMTKYQATGYKPFYRILSPTERWYSSKSQFWNWYTRAKKSGVYIKIYDTYDPSAPAYRP